MVWVLGKVVDTMGRRPPLLVSGLGVLTSNLGLGLSVINPNIPKGLETFLVLFWAYGFVASYSFGYGPLCNIVTSEIYPVKTRARATSIGAVTGQMWAFVVAMSFMSVTESIGLASTFFMFSTISAFCCLFCYRYVPETKGRSIEEV